MWGTEIINRGLAGAISAVRGVRVPGSGVLATVWGYVAHGVAAVLTSIYDFVASPKVWLAGATFFVAGWLASAVHLPAKPNAAVAALKSDVARLANEKASAVALAAEANQRALAAEAKVAELVKAAAPAPAAARPVYRPRKPAEPKPADPFAINWPKLPLLP